MIWSKYKLLFMYIALFYLGGATIFTRYKMSALSFDIGCIVAFVFVGLLVPFAWKSAKLKGLLVILSFVGVWTILQSVKWGTIDVFVSLYWDIIAGFIICLAYKEKVFFYFEHCVARLCLVALVLWIVSWAIPIVPPLLKAISPNWIHALEESNILIFGLQPANFDGALFFRRNCGFAWEPGRFASIIIMALFFNTARTHFRWRKNKNLWILLLALASTQSTTGFGALIIILLVYLYNAKKKYFIPLLILSGVFVGVVASLPFMGPKLQKLWITEDHNKTFEQQTTYWIKTEDRVIVPQRFDGLLWELYNVKKDPILGYGKDPVRSYTGELFRGNLVLYNGTIKVFSIFGLFFGAIFYIMLYKGSAFIAGLYRIKGSGGLLALFATVNISYPFQFEPLFLAMFAMPMYLSIEQRRKVYEESCNYLSVHR